MLEESYAKTSDYFFVIILINCILLVISTFSYIPYLAASLSNSITYVWTRKNPNGVVQIFGLIQFNAFYLPYVFPVASLIFEKRFSTNEILGIIAGQIVYYFLDVYPLFRKSVLKTPCWCHRLFNEMDECCTNKGNIKKSEAREPINVAQEEESESKEEEAINTAYKKNVETTRFQTMEKSIIGKLKKVIRITEDNEKSGESNKIINGLMNFPSVIERLIKKPTEQNEVISYSDDDYDKIVDSEPNQSNDNGFESYSVEEDDAVEAKSKDNSTTCSIGEIDTHSANSAVIVEDDNSDEKVFNDENNKSNLEYPSSENDEIKEISNVTEQDSQDHHDSWSNKATRDNMSLDESSTRNPDNEISADFESGSTISDKHEEESEEFISVSIDSNEDGAHYVNSQISKQSEDKDSSPKSLKISNNEIILEETNSHDEDISHRSSGNMNDDSWESN